MKRAVIEEGRSIVLKEQSSCYSREGRPRERQGEGCERLVRAETKGLIQAESQSSRECDWRRAMF